MASVVPTRRRTEPARRPRLARFARSHARGGGWSEISVEEAAEPTAPCRPARRPDVRVAQALGDLLVEVALGFLLHLGAERVRGRKREVSCDTHVPQATPPAHRAASGDGAEGGEEGGPPSAAGSLTGPARAAPPSAASLPASGSVSRENFLMTRCMPAPTPRDRGLATVAILSHEVIVSAPQRSTRSGTHRGSSATIAKLARDDRGVLDVEQVTRAPRSVPPGGIGPPHTV
jgi:hypothetical protein